MCGMVSFSSSLGELISNDLGADLLSLSHEQTCFFKEFLLLPSFLGLSTNENYPVTHFFFPS
mgnify:CR=1 FL=1